MRDMAPATEAVSKTRRVDVCIPVLYRVPVTANAVSSTALGHVQVMSSGELCSSNRRHGRGMMVTNRPMENFRSREC